MIVQLPNWGPPALKPDSVDGGWATIREGQLLALNLPNTAIVVTIDVGDTVSIHPVDKQPVGARLALAAQGAVYKKPLVYSGPIYSGIKIEGDSIRVTFKHVGGGLEARGGELKQFSIAGEDMKFVWSAARIDGNTVIGHSAEVPKPVAVRYAWATNPAGCNLYNKEGLPASPFRTDESVRFQWCSGDGHRGTRTPDLVGVMGSPSGS